MLLCCSTENQYSSYNFYLFLPYNGGSNNDDNTILSNNVDAWDPVPIYTYERWDPLTAHFDVCSMQSSLWAVGNKYNFWHFCYRSFWCLHWANIKMSWECISLLPLVILWVLVFGFWAIFPRTTTPYPSTCWVMFILLTHFCISRSLFQ